MITIADDLRNIANKVENLEERVDEWGRQKLIVISHPNQHSNRLTQNFMANEFACKDGSILILIDKRMLEGLQRIRDRLNNPIFITSAFRTWEHNLLVGGSSNSQHLLGTAVDIHSHGISLNRIADIAVEEGFTGIGIYRNSNFVHIDVRENPAKWEG